MEDLKTLYNFYLEQKNIPRNTTKEKERFKIIELVLLRKTIDKLLKEMEV